MTVFMLPDLGEGLQEAEIVTWHVSEGDHVITDQPLVSVETDKAVVEVPAPISGTIERLFAREGAVVAIGAQLVEIATGRSDDTGAIVGDIEQAKMAAPESRTAPEPKDIRAAPAVRRLAREEGVELTGVPGSGPGGAIQSKDILAAASDLAEGEDLRGVRRVMARVMARSHASVVPATVTDRADIQTWSDGEAATPRLVQAIAAACRKEPALNAWFDGRRRKVHDHVDLAIAVDTSDGLFAPVLRAADHLLDIETHIADLTQSVADRSIAAEAMQGATFTLSNFGMMAGEFASLVVTPPQVAILGAGRITDAVLAVGGKPAVRRVLPLSLTFDHRAVTGGEAARFLAAVRAELELSTHHYKEQ